MQIQPPLLGDTEFSVPHPPGGNTGQAPASSAPACREGIGRRRKVGGTGSGPTHTLPLPVPVLLPRLPLPLGLLLPSPSSQGSLENQALEKAQAWVSHGHSPFPRDLASQGGGLCLGCRGGGWHWEEPPLGQDRRGCKLKPHRAEGAPSPTGEP